MRIFGTIAAAHRHRQPRDVAAELEAAFGHRIRNDVTEERIACDDDVSARDKYAAHGLAEPLEEYVQSFVVFLIENREAR